MRGMLLKTSGIWVIMMIAAILNGALRTQILAPLLGPDWALPASGITLSLLVFLLAWLLLPVAGVSRTREALATGSLWVALTLAFEYLFGHFIAGKSWDEIHQVFDVTQGNLFVLVVITLGVSPWAVIRLRCLKRCRGAPASG